MNEMMRIERKEETKGGNPVVLEAQVSQPILCWLALQRPLPGMIRRCGLCRQKKGNELRLGQISE